MRRRNWKFDLASSEVLIGHDPVRTDPVAEWDGAILIDLSDPPARSQRARPSQCSTLPSPPPTGATWRARGGRASGLDA